MIVFHVAFSVLADFLSPEKPVLAMEKRGGDLDYPYIGSLVSLTSKREIRYEGILFTLDRESSTIVLKNVRSFGREGRGKNILHIPASDEVYEYITFRATDIKDLNVKAPPVRNNDPAKVQFNAIGNPLDKIKSIHGTGLLNDDTYVPDSPMFETMFPLSTIWKNGTNWWPCDCPTAPSSIYSGLPQPPLVFGHPTPSNSFHPGIQWENQKPVFPLFLDGVYGPSLPLRHAKSNSKQDPHMTSRIFPNSQQNGFNGQLPGFVSTSVETLVANSQQFNVLPMEEPKVNVEPEKLQSSSMQPLLPLPVSESQHMQLIKESVLRGNWNHRGRGRGGRRGRGQISGTYNSEVQQGAHTIPKFRNDFDFEAMNEQFNKKEVWKELGLGENKITCIEGKEEGLSYDTCEDIISDTSMCDTSKKPLFVEDFFDFLSCDDLDCKENRSERIKFSQQRKIDKETFGSFPLRSHGGRGGRKPGGLHRGALHTENLSNERLEHETSGNMSVKD